MISHTGGNGRLLVDFLGAPADSLSNLTLRRIVQKMIVRSLLTYPKLPILGELHERRML